jgi:hypothetical protein
MDIETIRVLIEMGLFCCLGLGMLALLAGVVLLVQWNQRQVEKQLDDEIYRVMRRGRRR